MLGLCFIAMLVPVAAFSGLTRPAMGAFPLLRHKSAGPLSRLPVTVLSVEVETWEPPAPLLPLVRRSQAVMTAIDDPDTCDITRPANCAGNSMPEWASQLNELQERGLGSVALLLATAISLSLTNIGSTSRAWLALWSPPIGPPIGGHALSLRGWVRPTRSPRWWLSMDSEARGWCACVCVRFCSYFCFGWCRSTRA